MWPRTKFINQIIKNQASSTCHLFFQNEYSYCCCCCCSPLGNLYSVHFLVYSNIIHLANLTIIFYFRMNIVAAAVVVVHPLEFLYSEYLASFTFIFYFRMAAGVVVYPTAPRIPTSGAEARNTKTTSQCQQNSPTIVVVTRNMDRFCQKNRRANGL